MKLIDEKTTYFDGEIDIADDVVIYPNNYFMGKVTIGSGCIIYPNNIIKDTTIGNNCIVTSSHITEASIGNDCSVGPNAYLRPHSVVGNGCRIGDFVELKNARLGNKTKVSHLSYVGDCEVGDNCNIGCGVVFVNYDGVKKQFTKVGNHCFIGSNCNVIAPVNIEDESYIAAGTTITQDIDSDSFVIGRAREVVKPNRATAMRAKFSKKED